MTLPEIVSRDEWLAARLLLLEQEKAAMRTQDAVTELLIRPKVGRPPSGT